MASISRPLPSHRLVALGIALVPEGPRRVSRG